MIAIPLHILPYDNSQPAREARMNLALTLSQMNPRGFRQPGLLHGTSLVERRIIEAGFGDEPVRYRSQRGEQKRLARALHVQTVKDQQRKEREKREAASRALARAIGGVSAFD